MLHVVFVSGEYALWATGGIGVFLQTISRELVKRGHSVSVVGLGNTAKEEILEDAGVLLYRLAVNTSKIPNFIINSKRIIEKLKQLHSENPIDIIETSEGGLAFLKSLPPAKKVIRLHGGHYFFSEAEKRGINWR